MSFDPYKPVQYKPYKPVPRGRQCPHGYDKYVCATCVSADEDSREREYKARQRAKIERDKMTTTPDQELARVLAENEVLRKRDEEWQKKASIWMASPQAVQWLDGYRELTQRINIAETKIEQQQAEIAAIGERAAMRDEIERLRKAIDSISDLIAESTGVYGLHLNGNVTPWCDLLPGGQFEEWLTDFDAVRCKS